MPMIKYLLISPVWLAISLTSISINAPGILAAASLSYLPDKANVKNIVLENELIRYTILLDRGAALAGAVEKTSGTDWLEGNPPLMFSSVGRLGNYLYSVVENKTGKGVSITVIQRPMYSANLLEIKQTFFLGDSAGLEWELEATNTSPRAKETPLYPLKWTTVEQEVTSNISFPLIQKLVLGGESETRRLFPGHGSYFHPFYIDSPETFFFYWTVKEDLGLPLDVFNSRLDRGIYFQIIESKLDFSFTDKNDFQTKSFSITQKPGEKTGILRCRIVPHRGDWHAAFEFLKKNVRDSFDFTYYKRPGQQDYRQRFLGHFTYLYDLEIYDPENNRFRIEEFLDEGKLNFGGYDYLLLWHNYPRLGVDSRDQFDVLDNLPGGLEGLRKLADTAHERGVKIFFSYNPWDIMKGRRDHAEQCARALKAIGGDGLFLDTMNDIDTTFRQALDTVNPDLVFTTEGRPNLKAAELITGSWQERGTTNNRMPTVDLLRFVIPEHIVFNTLRAMRNRENLVYNALFNGNGLLVWEDNFGDIIRVPPQERALIQRYRRIMHENRDAFLTDNPVPLVKNLRPDLYINAFPVDKKCVWPVYQNGREEAPWESKKLIGPFMEVADPESWHYVDVWNHQTIPMEIDNGRNRLLFPEEPDSPMSCVVGFPSCLKAVTEGRQLRISTSVAPENSSIRINTVNNLTWLEEERLELPGEGGTVELSQLNLVYPHLVLVKLLQGDILKDELVLNFGWKKF